ncbi:histidine phosphatase family protein [Phytoactinopolyspora limicola]|uniref:histidine phosphatase family protein n=1 Tax=Phytoactinopolyspora limicola TaxID=2715536 RepID=UPI001409C00E|nr:histidine phosphatase family protein [Phytoactinopolyspora limicola]
MGTRHLYLARHGAADTFGELTDLGRRQARLLGERLATVPVDAVWHSPLSRAAGSAAELARALPPVAVAAATELIDHVPYVPPPADIPAPWVGFFDGYDATEAADGHRRAEALLTRFATALHPSSDQADTHEVLVTHAYPIAWLVCHALDAPPSRWLGLDSANAALTIIEYRTGLPPTVVTFNDTGHLPADLRWTGFPAVVRP